MTYTKRSSLGEIQIVVDRWKQSGLSMVRFAKEENISPSTFYNWVRRTGAGEAGKLKNKPLPSRLIKLPKNSNESLSCTLEIATPKGYTVQVHGGASSSELEVLLRTVLSCLD